MDPVSGKTYSLFGSSDLSTGYFETVKELADYFLNKFDINENELLQILKSDGRNRFFGIKDEKIKFIKDHVKNHLSKYTPNVKGHLRTMSLLQRLDATLRTKEHQYHLYMIEIELVNRINRGDFLQAEFKMALFPHCLSDFRPRCLSEAGDIERICKACTKYCHINLGSKLLRKYGIEPYISATMDQRRFFKGLKNQHPSLGVLGIACIPELARGLRLCQSLGIPAIGIPLDANRCARWMRRAQETSFNLQELEAWII